MKLLPLEQHLKLLTDSHFKEADNGNLSIDEVHQLHYGVAAFVTKVIEWYNQPFVLEEIVNMEPRNIIYADSNKEFPDDPCNPKYKQAQEALLFEGWSAEANATAIIHANVKIEIQPNGWYWIIEGDDLLRITYIPSTRSQFINDCFRAGIILIASSRAEKELT